jgi:uncharacterized protein (TIGR02996 family)
MRDDGYHLLRAIVANPDDDLPRLVYADWLDEHEQPARAEFIRLQIERYHQSKAALEPTGINFREYELLRENEHAWRAELPPGFRVGCVFRRGFVYKVRCSIRDIFRVNEEHPLIAPIEHLAVTVDELSLAWLTQTITAFELPIKELVIRCQIPVGPLLVQTLPRYGPFDSLKILRIHDEALGDDGINHLLPESYPHVKMLDLSGCGIGDSGLIELAGSGWLHQLDELILRQNQISSACIDWLRFRTGNAVIRSGFE